MTITKEQAAQWAGSATAEQLTKLPSPSDGRLRASTCLTMLKCSTEVVHCFIEGGTEPPILPLNDSDHYLYRRWCEEVLRRDARKTQTSKGDYATRTGLANRSREDDPGFLVHEPARMHDYISEAVSWMLHGGRGRNNFRPLLWVGLRDWETSSAWTRGVVLLYAKAYKKTVNEGHAHHLDTMMNGLLGGEEGVTEQQLHSLSHLPSLTGRQARRSGVSQKELRARWA